MNHQFNKIELDLIFFLNTKINNVFLFIKNILEIYAFPKNQFNQASDTLRKKIPRENIWEL